MSKEKNERKDRDQIRDIWMEERKRIEEEVKKERGDGSRRF